MIIITNSFISAMGKSGNKSLDTLYLQSQKINRYNPKNRYRKSNEVVSDLLTQYSGDKFNVLQI